MHGKKLLVSTSAYGYLASRLLERAPGMEAATVEHKTFPDGERYLRIDGDLWGRDVVLLGGTPSDLDWLELYDLGCGIAHGGARSLAILMPYFGYSTMERAVREGEVVVAKTRARLISSIPSCEGGTRVYLFDLHTDGIAFYFDDRILTRHLYGAPIVTDLVRRVMGDRPFVLGACDAGRAKWVQSLAQRIGVEPAFVYKHRDAKSGTLSVTGVNADVAGREVVIYDDMIRTGSSLLQAGEAYRAAGATAVHAVASHLVLPGASYARLVESKVLDTVLGTDSHPGSLQLPSDHVATLADLLLAALP